MCVCVRAFIILSMSLCLFLCCSVFLLFFFLLLMVPVIVLYFYACKWKTKNAKHFLPFFFVLELQRLHLLFSDPCFSCSFFFFSFEHSIYGWSFCFPAFVCLVPATTHRRCFQPEHSKKGRRKVVYSFVCFAPSP